MTENQIIKGLLNVDLVPVQTEMLDKLTKKDKLTSVLIIPEGGGKNFLLSIYSILECITNPSYRIAVTAPTYNLSKGMAEHCTSLLEKTCLNFKVEKEPDRYKIKFPNESTITFLPLNDGSRICGARPNCLIVLDLSSIERNLFENLVAGFGITSIDPVKILEAKEKVLGRKLENYPSRLILTDHYENIKYHWIVGVCSDPNIRIIESMKDEYPEGFFDVKPN